MKSIKILFVVISVIAFSNNSFAVNIYKSIAPAQQSTDSNKKTDAAIISKDTSGRIQNNLSIDTALNKTLQQTVIPIDTAKKTDSVLVETVPDTTITNTRLFIYILLSVIGLGLFFFIFVINLFKTFHKKKINKTIPALKLEFIFYCINYLDFHNLGTCSRLLD